MELAEKCLYYIEEKIQEYIKENIGEITVNFIEEKYNNNVNYFIKNAIAKDMEEVYKDIINKVANDYWYDYIYDIDIEDDEVEQLHYEVFDTLELNAEFYSNDLCLAMKEYAKKNQNNPALNKKMTARELAELDDEVGDEFENFVRRDYDNRDAAFIDIDGEILVSEEGETHAQLVNKYLESIDKEKLDNTFNRPRDSVMSEFAENFGFGMIQDGVWFIDDNIYFGNMNSSEIVEDIKKSEYKPKKIYISDDGYLTRAAKLEAK